MERLSAELYVHILDFLSRVDEISLGLCCRYLYNEVYFKQTRFLLVEVYCYEAKKLRELIPKIPKLINNPSQQLELCVGYLDASYAPYLCEVLESVNYSVQKLVCTMQMIRDMAAIKPDIVIRTAVFEEEFTEEVLTSISDQDYDYGFKHIDTTRLSQLELSDNRHLKSIHFHSFLSGLQKLELCNCVISNVNMLGSVPDLTIRDCPNITDISSLNNNRSITIRDCKGIKDYDQSFEHSVIIRLEIEPLTYAEFNGNNLKSVKVLEITAGDSFFKYRKWNIPSTVTRCELYGIQMLGPISNINKVKQLTIGSHEISSIKNLGFEKLVVIELMSMNSLLSLNGLGSGKNRKITIRDCHAITDYSPLRYVHEVAIYTENVVDLDQLDHVHTLTIKAKAVEIDYQKSYHDHIYTLKTSKVKSRFGIKGLECIPLLTFLDEDLIPLMIYLGDGGKLQCQKLSFALSYVSSVRKAFRELARLVWEKYLQEEYEIHFHENSFVLLRKQAL